MTALRTTVIMKTDIKDSTVGFRGLLEADLSAMLADHRDFVARLSALHDGRIVKPEGDGFWVVFPSVTAAALTAMRMQEDLRIAQIGRGDDRLIMRIVITLGDVLHQEGALIGDAVVLATRIEALTPPDEIYLSAAAWLAANQAEVRTSFVDSFVLKGFPEPAPIYRVEQTHRTRVVTDQYIVFTDIHGFSRIIETAPIATIEKILDRLLELAGRVCREFSGTNRFSAGDSYCLTFSAPDMALAAAERLADEWNAFARHEGLRCSITVAVHKGVLYTFRSYLYGNDITIAAEIENVTHHMTSDDTQIFASGHVRRDLVGTSWEGRLEPFAIPAPPPRLAAIEVYRLR